MDPCTGSHNWRNAAANDETTDIILYAKNVLSIQTIMDKVKELLTQNMGRVKVLVLLCLLFFGCT